MIISRGYSAWWKIDLKLVQRLQASYLVPTEYLYRLCRTYVHTYEPGINAVGVAVYSLTMLHSHKSLKCFTLMRQVILCCKIVSKFLRLRLENKQERAMAGVQVIQDQKLVLRCIYSDDGTFELAIQIHK